MLPWQERLFWKTLYLIFMYVRHGKSPLETEQANEVEAQLKAEWDRQQ